MKSCFKMCYRRKMLLAAVIFTALCYKVTAVKQLDMAPEAVHYLYDGCNKQVLETVINSVLKEELNRSADFKKAWSDASSCSEQLSGGVKEHTTAVFTYLGSEDFREIFNDAVATKGGNVSTYENSFHFKSLHFLLMDSISRMNPAGRCKQLYLDTETEYTAKNGSKVRFGSFKKGRTTNKMMEEMEGGTVFYINSCFFISLEKKNCNLDDDLALITPAEEFTVMNVQQIDDENGKYTKIQLEHSKLARQHDCRIISRSPADVSTQWLVLVLLGFSLFFFNC